MITAETFYDDCGDAIEISFGMTMAWIEIDSEVLEIDRETARKIAGFLLAFANSPEDNDADE